MVASVIVTMMVIFIVISMMRLHRFLWYGGMCIWCSLGMGRILSIRLVFGLGVMGEAFGIGGVLVLF